MSGVDVRAIRVFVSSTFRDMVAERDGLATHAWPALRAVCEDRAVTFTDVDLRWGITREQAERGEVLPICLAEIDASRPYFIGILGDRYGWVPDEIPEHLVKQLPWLAEHRTRSVTELEMIHGVLNDPEMESRAFFYFRSPEAVGELELASGEVPSQNDQATRRLEDLKARIRSSGLPLREGFLTPEQLAQEVIADLTAAIDDRFPAEATPDPLERSRLAHDAYALSRRGVYIGREEYFCALDAHVVGDGAPLVITGQSGGGKSALLANWAEHQRAAHPDIPFVEHYTGAGADATDWAAMCRRIAGELSRLTGVSVELPLEPAELRAAFKTALTAFSKAGRAIVLVDGLNQLDDRDSAPDLAWLPREMPAGIRFVASTLPGRSLDEVERRSWAKMAIEPLSTVERSELLDQYLHTFAKTIEPELAHTIATAPQSANPLFLRVLIDELRVSTAFEDLKSSVDRYLSARDPAELYGLVLDRWERDYERERSSLVREMMSAVWAARRGLSESELLMLLGVEHHPMPRAMLSPLYLAARGSLVSRSGLLGFAHDFLRKAVEVRYLAAEHDRQLAHEVIARAFARLDCTSPRVIEELPWQYRQAGKWDCLKELLIDTRFLEAAWSADTWDLRRNWTALAESTHHTPECAYEGLLEDPATSGESLAYVGALLRDSGRSIKAAEYLQEAKNRLTPDAEVLGTVEVGLSDMTHIMGKYHEAADDGERLKASLAHRVGKNSPVYHEAVLRLAHYYKFFDLIRAREELESLRTERLESRNEATLMFALGGSVMSLLGEVEEGTQLLGQALLMAEENNDADLVARCCRRLVDYELSHVLPDFDKAWGAWNKGIEAAKSVSSRQAIYLNSTRGEIHRAERNFPEAIHWHTRGKAAAESAGITGWVAHSTLGIAETKRQQGEDSSELVGEALRLYQDIGQSWGLVHASVTQALVAGPGSERWAQLGQIAEKAREFGYVGDVRNINELLASGSNEWRHPLLFP